PNGMPDGRSYDEVTEESQEAAKQMPDGEAKDAKEREANELYGEWKRQSWLGQAGQALEPVFRPLGWDWKIGMSALASFPAREVIVGTLGIVYNQGEVDPNEVLENKNVAETPLGKTIREEWSKDPQYGKYRVPVALSLLVFFALCCQCVSTLAVIKRETRSWLW